MALVSDVKTGLAICAWTGTFLRKQATQAGVFVLAIIAFGSVFNLSVIIRASSATVSSIPQIDDASLPPQLRLPSPPPADGAAR